MTAIVQKYKNNLGRRSYRIVTKINGKQHVLKFNPNSDEYKFLDNNKSYIDSPSLLIEYQYLKQNLSFKQGVMVTLLQQIEIAKLSKVNIKPVVGVLDNPEVPGKKSSPTRKIYLIAGLFFGIIAHAFKVVYLSTKG